MNEGYYNLPLFVGQMGYVILGYFLNEYMKVQWGYHVANHHPAFWQIVFYPKTESPEEVLLQYIPQIVLFLRIVFGILSSKIALNSHQ